MNKRRHLPQVEDDPLGFLDWVVDEPQRAIFFDGSKPICGAKTRKGTPCRCKLLLNGLRCRFHGGNSTGPRTPEGKRRIAEANRRRWETYREARDDIA